MIVRHSSPPNQRHGGFTLIELLAVLLILGLIGSIAAPRVLEWLDKANVDAARLQIEALGNSLDLYRLEVGSYPPNLAALVTMPPGVDRWSGPYLRKRFVPKDPWERDYHYRMPGEHGPYDLYSLGADGLEGGEGKNADISSWR